MHNPIIPGFNPDPSVCRVGKDYYLVTSSFQYFPGVPIYHSPDLVNWRHIGNILSRPTQVPDLDITLTNGGIWAPTLRYHKGLFYMITTMVLTQKPHSDFSRWRNFFVTATDPAGPWSDPVFFDYPGYDTSFFFSDDNSSTALVQGSFYHRIRKEISQSEVNLLTGETTAPKRLWSGTGEIAPEAPHILLKDGWYYLIIAEGGTEFGHRVAMARARSIQAPEEEWEPCPSNPVLSHADLPDELVQCTGHADLFDDDQGNWWMVFLASRAYDGKRFPMGRETYLVRVEWPEGAEWPVVRRPIRANPELALIPDRDDHVQDQARVRFGTSPAEGWSIEWLWLRLPEPGRFVLADDADGPVYGATIIGTSATLASTDRSPSMVGIRQCHVRCRVTVKVERWDDGIEAGLVAFLDPLHQFSVGVSDDAVLFAGVKKATVKTDQALRIAIQTEERAVHFEYLREDGLWDRIGSVDNEALSVGFTGVILGIYVQGAEKTAHFRDYTYQVLV